MKCKKLVLIISVAIALISLWFIIGYISAQYLTSRRPQFLNPNSIAQKEDLIIRSEDGLNISAWYIKGNSDKAVIILSGIGGDRHGSISRAKFYNEKGFSVLLPDLRATGKSEGNIITFGWYEAKDLKACYKFLKQKGSNKIAAHGCSLGAATITYTLNEIRDFYFIVLESCYDNLDNAFSNRVNKFYLPDLAYFPIRLFVEKRINAKIEELRPEEYIKLSNCPTLILAGDSEDQIKIDETKKIFNNCPSMQKDLYIFKNGKHEDFAAKFPNEFDKVLNDFINKY